MTRGGDGAAPRHCNALASDASGSSRRVAREIKSLPVPAGRAIRLADADRVGRTAVLLRRVLLQLLHDQLDRLLELRVLARDDILRPLLHFDVRSDAFVLDGEAGVRGPEGHARSGDIPAVHQLRVAANADEPAPGPLADQGPQLVLAEHPREHVAAGASTLVDQQHLRAVNRGTRDAPVVTVARGEVAEERLAENVDVVVGDPTA